MTEVEQRIANARTKLLIQHPFFATLVMGMPMELTTETETAETNGLVIRINPDFIASIDPKYDMFVIAHEVGHVIRGDCVNPLNGRDPEKLGMAEDYAWNLVLKDAKSARSGQPCFDIWPQALCDDKYREPKNADDLCLPMSSDKIYNLLPDPPKQPSGGGGSGDKHGHGCKVCQAPGTKHDPAKREAMKRDIQRRVAQAMNAAKMMGALDAGLERLCKEIIDPKVPWYDTLRHLMTEYDKCDDDWNHRNRRFQDIYLPTDSSECKMGEFIAIGDTSGSISDKEMAEYMGEFRGVAEQCKPERMRLIWADTKVAGEQVFEEHDELIPRPKGGGGTDMRVPLKYVEQYEPKIVVLFTDGYTPWPEVPPEYPLIVCCTTGHAVPVGEVIRI